MSSVGRDADLGEGVYSSCPSTPGVRRMSEGKDEVENENNESHYTNWNEKRGKSNRSENPSS